RRPEARPLADLSDFQPAELSDFGPALTLAITQAKLRAVLGTVQGSSLRSAHARVRTWPSGLDGACAHLAGRPSGTPRFSGWRPCHLHVPRRSLGAFQLASDVLLDRQPSRDGLYRSPTGI